MLRYTYSYTAYLISFFLLINGFLNPFVTSGDTVCNAASIICTRLFREKMHSDWFNGIETLQGRWQHGEKVGYC